MGGLNAPMEAGREVLLLKSTEGGAYYFYITYETGTLSFNLQRLILIMAGRQSVKDIKRQMRFPYVGANMAKGQLEVAL